MIWQHLDVWGLTESDQPRLVWVCYDPAVDPLSLRWHFARDRVWFVSRDLLDAGLHGIAGDGDVRVWPERAARRRVGLRLSNLDESITLRLRRRELAELLGRCYRLVLRGEEHRWLDWDRVVGDILEDSWPTW